MKTNRWIVMSAAGIALVATTALALAQQEDSHWIERRVAKRVVSRMEGRLSMTATQKEEVKSILKNEEPAIVALAAQSRQEREELAAMQSFDEGRVREVAQRYAATNTAILVERAKVRMELRAVLNDAQRKQLEGMRVKMGAHPGERLETLIDAI